MAIDRQANLLEIPRAVEFYVVKQASADHGPVNIEALMKDMDEKPKDERPGLIKSNDEHFHYWVTYSQQTKLVGLRIGITRKKAQSGKVSRVDHEWKSFGMNSDEDQIETSHMVFFPHGIVAFEFNPFGPRLSQLTNYLFEKFQHHGKVSFETCAKPGIKNKLENFSRVGKATFTITPANIELYADLLGDDFATSRKRDLELSGADSITIEFKINLRKKERGSLANYLHNFTGHLLALNDPKKALEMSKAKFHATNSRAMDRKLMDILQDKIETDALFDLYSLSDRRVDSNKAYITLRKAYDEMTPDLEKAVTVKLQDYTGRQPTIEKLL